MKITVGKLKRLVREAIGDAEMKTIELDVASDYGGVGYTYNLDRLVDKVEHEAGRYYVSARLVNPSGPGGGNPVFEFTGAVDDLFTYVLKYFADGNEEEAEFLIFGEAGEPTVESTLREHVEDPHDLIGKEVPAADGGNYGHRVLSYDPRTKDYVVQPINWKTGASLGQENTIDAYKITYRYNIDRARPAKSAA